MKTKMLVVLLATVLVGCGGGGGEVGLELARIYNDSGALVATGLEVTPGGTVSVPVPGIIVPRISGVKPISDPTITAQTGATKNLCNTCTPVRPVWVEPVNPDCHTCWIPWAVGGGVAGLAGIIGVIVDLSPPPPTEFTLVLPAFEAGQSSYLVQWQLPGGSFDFWVVDSTPPPTGEGEGEGEGEYEHGIVPNVVGMTEADAMTTIETTCLVVGHIAGSASATVPIDSVIRSIPSAQNVESCGSGVDLVISTGPPSPQTVIVPNLVGMTQAEAGNRLATTCLTTSLDLVTFTASEAVPTGQVVSQAPSANATVSCGTAVSLVVSTGPPPPQTVIVPNLTGLNWAQADVALANVGLSVGEVTTEANNTIPANIIIRWDPTGRVVVRTLINITVSTGPPPPQTVIVPNLAGLNLAQARALLAQVGLVNGDGNVTTVSSSTVPIGIIATWSPTGSVLVGTTVSVVVSTGPAPPLTISVPNVVGLTQDVAETEIGSTCLVLGTVTMSSSATVPAGYVISQSIVGLVTCNTVVSLVISTGPPPVIPLEITLLELSSNSLHVGDTLTISASFNGDPSLGKFQLVLRCAGKKDLVRKFLPTYTDDDAIPGKIYKIGFAVTASGNGDASVFVRQGDAYKTQSLPYTVTSP